MFDKQNADLDAVQVYNKERKEDLEITFKQFSQREQDQEKNMLNLKVSLNNDISIFKILNIGLQRYRNYLIRVCGIKSNPFLNFCYSLKFVYLYIILQPDGVNLL